MYEKKIISVCLLPLFFVAYSQNVGLNTDNPQRTLHVNGDLQLTGELNVGGDANTSGYAGNVGEVLVSNGPGAVPVWRGLYGISGTLAMVHYISGTESMVVKKGETKDVPGVSLEVEVPSGNGQIFMFTILGYAVMEKIMKGSAAQGVFSLLVDGQKVSSAYVSSGDGGGLSNLPAPVTFLDSVALDPGKHTFQVQYTSWSGDQVVNYNPSDFKGYNNDKEAMLTKMQVLIVNR